MSYEFYWISGSPYAWMAMLAMKVKQLGYVSHRMDPSKGEHKTPEYLSINPRGKVPALKHGETIIYESIAIMAYLDQLHPEPPLFGTSPAETALVWQRWSEILNYSREAISLGIVTPIFRGLAIEESDLIRDGLPELQKALKWGEEILGAADYLAGQTISAADLAYVPVIASLIRALSRDEAAALDLGVLPLENAYPKTAAWLQRMENIPGYDDAYPPHWKA